MKMKSTYCIKNQSACIFDDTHENKRLNARILKTIETKDVFICLQKCVRHHCKSININKDRGICELLGTSLLENKDSEIKEDMGWVHYGSTIVSK